MSGHNKFSKIKHLKARNDAQKSKLYTKLGRLIAVEAKKANGNVNSPGLSAAIEKARRENMPNETIERAVKRATEQGSAMENILYEAYGPGGVAILIDVLTDNRNKASQEIRAILSGHNISLASPGSASWAFQKGPEGWAATTTMPVPEDDAENLSKLIEELEENDDVQDVYTNGE